MNMMAALIVLVLVAVLVVIGVKLNMYLYASGALRRANLMRSTVGAVTLSQEAFIDEREQDFFARGGQSISEMSSYARRFFLIVLSIAIFVGLAIALFVNTMPK
jgi:hypothetical protein